MLARGVEVELREQDFLGGASTTPGNEEDRKEERSQSVRHAGVGRREEESTAGASKSRRWVVGEQQSAGSTRPRAGSARGSKEPEPVDDA